MAEADSTAEWPVDSTAEWPADSTAEWPADSTAVVSRDSMAGTAASAVDLMDFTVDSDTSAVGFFPNRYYYGYGYHPWGYASGWGYPYYVYPYYNYSYPSYSYPSSYYGYGSSASSPVVIYQSQPQAVVYEAPQQPEIPTSSHQGDEKTVYLIALKGQDNICAAQAYWVTQNTLHFITLEGEAKQALISSVDRAFTFRLNWDRQVEFRLPPDK